MSRRGPKTALNRAQIVEAADAAARAPVSPLWLLSLLPPQASSQAPARLVAPAPPARSTLRRVTR